MNINPLSIGFIFLGGLGLVAQLYNLRKARQSSHWVSTTAIIKASYLDVSKHHGDESDSIYPAIEYEYKVAGKLYRGNTIAFGRGYIPADPKRYLKKYPAGKSARIHYNPDNWQESCLEPGIGSWFSLGIIIPAIFLYTGIHILLS